MWIRYEVKRPSNLKVSRCKRKGGERRNKVVSSSEPEAKKKRRGGSERKGKTGLEKLG
jgi:hypothetical protein